MKRKKKNRTRLKIIIICLLMVAVGAGSAGFYYLSHRPAKTTEEKAEVSKKKSTKKTKDEETTTTKEDSSATTQTEEPVEKKVVCIDAGHQAKANNSKEAIGPGSSQTKPKVTGGATGIRTRNLESEINLKVALKLQTILQERGYTVIMCRTSQDVDMSNQERAAIANNAQADAFVRIHCDSSTSSNVSGASGLAPANNNPYLSSELIASSQALTKSVLNHLVASTGTSSRGLILVNNMSGINWAQVPVCLIEMGFLSNPTEDANLGTDSYQDKCATGIADGIEDFLQEQQ